jgi:hypothetical protein
MLTVILDDEHQHVHTPSNGARLYFQMKPGSRTLRKRAAKCLLRLQRLRNVAIRRNILIDGIEFTEYTTGGYMHHDCRESSLLSECRLAYPEDCAGTLSCQPQFNSVQ